MLCSNIHILIKFDLKRRNELNLIRFGCEHSAVFFVLLFPHSQHIPYLLVSTVYTGEKRRKWKTQWKEYEDNVWLTGEGMQTGNVQKAERRMNEKD